MNNFFIFPGMSFGAISCHAKTRTLTLTLALTLTLTRTLTLTLALALALTLTLPLTLALALALTLTLTLTLPLPLTRCHAKTIPENFFMVDAPAPAQTQQPKPNPSPSPRPSPSPNPSPNFHPNQVAAEAVAQSLDAKDLEVESVVPHPGRIREVSEHVATSVVLAAQAQRLTLTQP